jgi:hypothetical protein
MVRSEGARLFGSAPSPALVGEDRALIPRGGEASVIPWHETAHLALDHAGDLWLWESAGGGLRLKWLGPVAERPEVPAGLEGERAECWDLWTDQGQARERDGWEATYRRQSGVFRAL